MLGRDFRRALRAAQAGDEAAFVRLWRDANPVMVRYLRVIGVDDPYDAACEGWITVVRGLPGYHGDETAWRVWLLACARMRAQEGNLRQTWGSVTVLPGVVLDPFDEPLELDDLVLEDDVERRGVGDSIAAIKELPLGQGEVLMLRLCAELPLDAVAHVVGTDVDSVERTEQRALERLEVDRELLAWSLAAPALPAELADERVAVRAFQSIPTSRQRSGVRVVAVGPRAARAGAARAGAGGARASGRSRGRRPAPGSVGAWSRSALVGVAAVSASVVSLGGLGAAAYTGSLPGPVQQALHDAIGAPAPSPSSSPTGGHHPGPSGRGGSGPGIPGVPGASPTSPVRLGTSGAGTSSQPGASSSAGSPTSLPGQTGVPPATTTGTTSPPTDSTTSPPTDSTTSPPTDTTTQGASPTTKPGNSPTTKKGKGKPTPPPSTTPSSGSTSGVAPAGPTPSATETVPVTTGTTKGQPGKGQPGAGKATP